VKNVIASGELLAHFINDLLDSRKMENNTFEINKGPTQVRPFLRELGETLRYVLIARNSMKSKYKSQICA